MNEVSTNPTSAGGVLTETATLLTDLGGRDTVVGVLYEWAILGGQGGLKVVFFCFFSPLVVLEKKSV